MLCSNIPAKPAYGVYISNFIRYSRACDSYQESSFRKFYGRHGHEYVTFVVNTSRVFPHLLLITGFVTRLTRQVPLVEQELLTLPEHLSSPPAFSGVRVTRSLVLCV